MGACVWRQKIGTRSGECCRCRWWQLVAFPRRDWPRHPGAEPATTLLAWEIWCWRAKNRDLTGKASLPKSPAHFAPAFNTTARQLGDVRLAGRRHGRRTSLAPAPACRRLSMCDRHSSRCRLPCQLRFFLRCGSSLAAPAESS